MSLLHNLTATVTLPSTNSKLQVRIAVSVFFFCQGVCFASWASRIPDIKTALHLNEAGFANILLALAIGQLVTMPFSGRAVTRFGSKSVLRIAIVFYAVALTNIGLVKAPWQLALSLFLFGRAPRRISFVTSVMSNIFLRLPITIKCQAEKDSF